MSGGGFRLEPPDITSNVDERIKNIVRSYDVDTDNPDRDTVLWLCANWQHARAALVSVIEADSPGMVAALALGGLDVQGE